jgi:hypothetical protein
MRASAGVPGARAAVPGHDWNPYARPRSPATATSDERMGASAPRKAQMPCHDASSRSVSFRQACVRPPAPGGRPWAGPDGPGGLSIPSQVAFGKFTCPRCRQPSVEPIRERGLPGTGRSSSLAPGADSLRWSRSGSGDCRGDRSHIVVVCPSRHSEVVQDHPCAHAGIMLGHETSNVIQVSNRRVGLHAKLFGLVPRDWAVRPRVSEPSDVVDPSGNGSEDRKTVIFPRVLLSGCFGSSRADDGRATRLGPTESERPRTGTPTG